MEGEDINPQRYLCYRGLDSVCRIYQDVAIFGGQILHRAGHYFFLIRLKASLNYLGKLPKNLQYYNVKYFLLIPAVAPVSQHVTHVVPVTYLQ